MDFFWGGALKEKIILPSIEFTPILGPVKTPPSEYRNSFSPLGAEDKNV